MSNQFKETDVRGWEHAVDEGAQNTIKRWSIEGIRDHIKTNGGEQNNATRLVQLQDPAKCHYQCNIPFISVTCGQI